MPQGSGRRQRESQGPYPTGVVIVTQKKARTVELHGNNLARGALELMPALHSTSRFAGCRPRDGGAGRGGPPSDASTGARTWKEVPHAEDRKHRASAEGR